MRVLITGAAGNLGSLLARHMLGGAHQLRLMWHRKALAGDLIGAPNVEPVQADLADPTTVGAACEDVDAIMHFAGVLFQPRPERFLPTTNVQYVRHLAAAAADAGVGRFILISFPHVEGESTPDRPAAGRRGGEPASIHARTRLAAEDAVFHACAASSMTPIILRPGMVYATGVLMIEAARWLVRRRLLGVWPKPTWIHLLSLPDFNTCVVNAIERPDIEGIYNLGDDQPITLQAFLDALAQIEGKPRPWRAPAALFPIAGALCELWAMVFGTASPLTRDFIRIGMASYVMDTSRMRAKLLSELAYPTFAEGSPLLQTASE